MENLVMIDNFDGFFRGKSVFLTGHTGFKGAWLTEWLIGLGARVVGYSLPPENTSTSLYYQLNHTQRIESHYGDIRNLDNLKQKLAQASPDIVFHTAAQPLVRESYNIPVETFDTNVMGTVNVLESLRQLKKNCIAIIITTDKCYKNREWLHGYRETDAMGGHDPYSASKGMAELAVSAYRSSFFSLNKGSTHLGLASARAGNVIGGGDWAKDRIIPDCIRALSTKKTIEVRNKTATRPWQHVLEPLSGYLTLATSIGKAMKEDRDPNQININEICTGFNFGPTIASNRTVKDLVEEVTKHWPGKWEDKSDPDAPHEASKLNLSIDQAFHLLKWLPKWNFETTIQKTVEWYLASFAPTFDAQQFTLSQISDYSRTAHD
ncbi:MAG: CDP-glucose 4,6-dehydratase [Opitutales bacterium]|nr:CDP-glucose 4,6-dehydratase [Opitutales bacterium]